MSTDPYVRYDYAWKTPGWNVQNPVINYGVDGYVDPGLPTDVSMVNVYGSFMELDSGRGLEGVLRLRVDRNLVHGPTGRQIPAGALKPIRFRSDGFSIYLPATNDPDLTPAFQYEARLTVRGVHQEFAFSLPAATPSVNFLTLLPVS